MKRLAFVLLLMSVLVFTMACGGGATQPTPEKTTPVDNSSKEEPKEDAPMSYKEKTIEIGVIDYPPYEMVKDGEIVGPGVDTIKEVFDRMGYKYEIKEYPWARMLEMLKTGELDIIVDAYVTTEREGFIDFSKVPYATFPQVLIARKDSGIKFDGNLESLKDYSIGITRGYAYGEKMDTLIKDKTMKFEESDSAEDLITKIAGGNLDLAADTQYTGNALIEKLGIGDKVVILDPPFDSLYSYLGFSKKNDLAGLRDEYDAMWQKVVDDGTFKTILEKHDIGDMYDLLVK